MTKFEKGYSYLAITVGTIGKRGWIIQQTGQKSWVATQFTECITEADGDYTAIMGNGIKVFQELRDRSNVADIEIMKVATNSSLRQTMFNVLMYGSFWEEN